MNAEGFAYFRWAYLMNYSGACQCGWECSICRYQWLRLQRLAALDTAAT